VQHIIAHDDLEGPVNVVAPAPVTFKTMVLTLSSILGHRTYVRVPGFVLRLAMGEVAGEFLEGDANLRPERLEASGFRHLYPGIESALRHELGLPSTEAERRGLAAPGDVRSSAGSVAPARDGSALSREGSLS